MYQKENINNYDLVLGLFQVIDLMLNVSQVSNDVLLKELENQNEKYLKKIIKQNEEILSYLKKD